MIQIEGLTKRYGSLTALDNCTLEIPTGQIFGLLGPNGSGKSTLLRLLLGMLKPTAGNARIDGLDCYSESLAVRHRTSYMPGDIRLFRGMRARATIQSLAKLRKQDDLRPAWQLAETLELDLDRRVKAMSTGMRQKLALVVALSTDSPLLVLDEPTANLDPTIRGKVISHVAGLGQQGRTVIFSSHVLPEIEHACDRVGILSSGKLVHLASLDDLSQVHRIVATTSGQLPPQPADLATRVKQISSEQGELVLEVTGELAPVMRWLADAGLEQIRIEPMRLQSVYERFHAAATADLLEAGAEQVA